MKSPDHPVPSGDRSVARLWLAALRAAGFDPGLASTFRSYEGAGDPEEQRRLEARGEREAAALAARYRRLPPDRRPRLWFSYHVYYKSPDWLGPRVSHDLGIPYVIAEGSRAGKRAGGPWATGHRGAEAALDRARLVLAMSEPDLEALERSRPPGQRLVWFPPFLDGGWIVPPAAPRPNSDPALLAVGMMREGDKLSSYRLLADALMRVAHLPWTLDVVGDGPARSRVEDLFASLAPRVRFRGQVNERPALSSLYGAADLFVWPAVNEAYGMVFLEAQAHGCPVVAGGFPGVSSVVRNGTGGLLTAPGDAGAFAEGVEALLRDPPLRGRLGGSAHAFVLAERSLDGAAERLRAELDPLVGELLS
jgi:glycosyltransferase involved in cell wall biosynthesis